MEFKIEKGMPTNFRDLGGMRTSDGKEIVKCRILRSGELSRLSKEAEVCLQKQYQLREILDLRTLEERTSAPDCPVEGAAYRVLDFFAGDAGQGNSYSGNGSREQMEKMRDIEQVHTYMEQLYRSFVTSPFARRALKELVEIFMRTEEGAVLFHCFAGKDRTGISAAVLLTLLGVSEEDIFADYLQTNKLRYEANQIILAGTRKQMEQAGVPDVENICAAIEAALSVDARYLEASYDEAEKEYGSFENYIFEGIGITKEEREKLCRLYLQK